MKHFFNTTLGREFITSLT